MTKVKTFNANNWHHFDYTNVIVYISTNTMMKSQFPLKLRKIRENPLKIPRVVFKYHLYLGWSIFTEKKLVKSLLSSQIYDVTTYVQMILKHHTWYFQWICTIILTQKTLKGSVGNEYNGICWVLTCYQWNLKITRDLKCFNCNPHGFNAFNGSLVVYKFPLLTCEDSSNDTL